MALEDDVAVALLVERELILEARAATAAHAHAQPCHAHVGLLGGEELVHLLGALVGDLIIALLLWMAPRLSKV